MIKKAILLVTILFSIMSEAQENKQLSLVNVTGEGKVYVTPDFVTINVSVETKGLDAIEVKKNNDVAMDKILKFLTKIKLPKDDVLTQKVSLTPNYDYDTKINNFIANQTVVICLKNLAIYDTMIEGLVSNGVNRIDSIEFKSTKMEQFQSEARINAIKNAKHKAEDYVAVLGQKIGRAFTISENSQPNFNPQPMYKAMLASDSAPNPKETLAVGKIEIVSNVSVSFVLD